MATAEQFLQLLEEKDLVSLNVLQAARREVKGTSPPPDAVGISLWLVQGQHITASQAERLLAATMERASFSRWQKGEPKPTEVLRVPIPPPPAPPRFAPQAPESPSPAGPGESPPPKPQSAAQKSLDELELAPEPAPGHAAATKPLKSSPPAAKAPSAAATPAAAPRAGPKPAGSPGHPRVGRRPKSAAHPNR